VSGEGRAKGSSFCFYLGKMGCECSPSEKMVSCAGRPNKATGSSENPASFMLKNQIQGRLTILCICSLGPLTSIYGESPLCHDSRHYGKLQKRKNRVLLMEVLFE